VVAKENVEVFVENMFGRADLSDRSISGLIRLAKFAKVYLNSADYVATHIAVAIEEVTTDQAIIAPARAISVQVQSEHGVEKAISSIDKIATSFSSPWPLKN
jgi:hypothetical protein